jgi:hypothetical protein
MYKIHDPPFIQMDKCGLFIARRADMPSHPQDDQSYTNIVPQTKRTPPMDVASLAGMVLVLALVMTISRLVDLADRLARLFERSEEKK